MLKSQEISSYSHNAIRGRSVSANYRISKLILRNAYNNKNIETFTVYMCCCFSIIEMGSILCQNGNTKSDR